ncbi:MAG: hypothetical protein P4L91_19785 [Burkholderiaceae bacterium]|nr:hypothetical protein [Burkholderiaceae bacterium]
MCDWSSWTLICEGHYEIELTVLLAIAFLVGLSLALILALNKRRKLQSTVERAVDNLQEALHEGRINGDEFLKKCDDVRKHPQ